MVKLTRLRFMRPADVSGGVVLSRSGSGAQKRMRRLGAGLLSCVLAVFFLSAAVSAAPAPVSVVETFHTGLLNAIRVSDGKGFAARRAKMAPVITQAFDTAYMVQVAAGTYWDTMSADQRKTLTAAFRDMTVANYASRFKSYKGQSFEILNTRPVGKRTLVKSELKRKDGDPVSIDYVVQPAAKGGFGIVDVRLGGTISELALRRSEFAPVLRDKGYAGLIALLQDKTKEIAAEASTGP